MTDNTGPAPEFPTADDFSRWEHGSNTADLLAGLSAAHDQYNGIARETAGTIRLYWHTLVTGGIDTNSALYLTLHYQDRLLRMIMPIEGENPNEEN